MLEKLTKATFENTIQEGICLVIVSAPWCPDCRKIEPIIEILRQEYGTQMKFFAIMADEEEALKESLNVRRIPTLIFYKNGVEVGERLVEPNSKPLIEEAIHSALKA
ncbi:co-chaperone YbbN [Helicobacter sp.]|uniref:thioredoxin family protein n=1 Tax=Helicobacter sp. TaxID=218 RepID=UPI00198B9BE8|nr:thioredoxin family protein [Helicobacter sp.]MBD5165905.1 thioredoxin family protein [Helicobacter sp.]